MCAADVPPCLTMTSICHNTQSVLYTHSMALALQGVTDPEAKRKAIGAGFIRVFQHYADSFQANHGFVPKYLVQVGAGPVLLQDFL